MNKRNRRLAKAQWDIPRLDYLRKGYLGYLSNDWRYPRKGFPKEGRRYKSAIRAYLECEHEWGRKRRMSRDRRNDPFKAQGVRCMKCGCWQATILRHRDGTISRIPIEEEARREYFRTLNAGKALPVRDRTILSADS